jgi:hypothetical protein
MHDEDFYTHKKQRQLQYQRELDQQVHSRRPMKADLGVSTPSRTLHVELGEANQVFEEQPVTNLGRYRKKHQIENHTSLLTNGTHILGGALQRDEAEILRRKKEQQRREMHEALQQQINEKNARQHNLRMSSAVPVRPVQSPEFIVSPNKHVEPVLLFNLDSTVGQDLAERREQDNSDLFRKSHSVSLPKDDETLDYLSQLCQKLLKEQDELKSKVISQDSIIESLMQSKIITDTYSLERVNPTSPQVPPRHRPTQPTPQCMPKSTGPYASKIETPVPRRQLQPPQRKTSAQKIKQREELARISEIDQKIEAARKRAENQRNVKTRIETKPSHSRLDQPTPPRNVATTNARSAVQSLCMQPFMPKLSNEVELPPLLSALSAVPRAKDEVSGKSHFIYPNSEGHFEDSLEKFMHSSVGFDKFRY